MEVIPTRHGFRLRQHGAVLSEVRTTAGPTHSVFDLLAATIVQAPARARIGLLGFAGGGLVAPLMALDPSRRLEAVDLDPHSHLLFRRHCPAWADRVDWCEAEAASWLRGERRGFDLLVEDLSVAAGGDVHKPEASWTALPGLIRRRLRPGGTAVFNLLPPVDRSWAEAVDGVAAGFGGAVLVRMEDFQNRILLAGDALPDARTLGTALRTALRRIGSRQAGRIRLVTPPRPGSAPGA